MLLSREVMRISFQIIAWKYFQPWCPTKLQGPTLCGPAGNPKSVQDLQSKDIWQFSISGNTVLLERGVKVPISSKFIFPHLILHFMQWTSAKKFFDLDKKRFCYECLKTWKSYFLAVDPCRWSQHQHAQSCDVDSGMCDFRLELSRFFYLKFSFVVHAKCSFPACCMNY